MSTSVAMDALSEFVKPENIRPPRPDDMTVSIPSGDQTKHGSQAGRQMVFSINDLDHIPSARFKQAPVYPYDMRNAKIKGEVHVTLIVDAKGRVIDVRIASSSNPSFENNALEAARKWRFESGTRGGVPVSFTMDLPLVFNFKD
jgi:protein TonB